MAAGEPFLKTVGWLGETWGFWLQVGVSALAGIAAVAAVFCYLAQVRLFRIQIELSRSSHVDQQKLLRDQLESQEKHSRYRATVDVVRIEQTDRELVEAYKKYAQLREAKGTLTRIAGSHPDPLDDHSLIMRVLNNYEYIAVGIHTGAFDEEIYKRMKRSTLIRDWDALKPYVCELRQKYDKKKIFVEFEALAEKWRS